VGLGSGNAATHYAVAVRNSQRHRLVGEESSREGAPVRLRRQSGKRQGLHGDVEGDHDGEFGLVSGARKCENRGDAAEENRKVHQQHRYRGEFQATKY
jgi:hypothetical protein